MFTIVFAISSGVVISQRTREPPASFVLRLSSGNWECTRCALCGDDLRVRVLKCVGKPDAGNPHVRFDERGTETGLRLDAWHPRRSSTLPAFAPLRRDYRPLQGKRNAYCHPPPSAL